ncbi:GNAT family N-acetyltransferase [Kitasatospora sp. NPDC048286]|uniref:GNAT family N-acetyltransferase n=1 Tax=Kitasatospora sp. NPDC048286 TaxID=3364047 RepID=UPI0037107274
MAGTEEGPETVLTTERLVVRQWTMADQDRAFDIYSRSEVARWIGRTPRAMTEPEEARAFIERCRKRSVDPRYGAWAIERRDTGVVAGTVLLVPLPDGDGEIEAGWHLHPDSWGQGIATEAARAVLARGFADGLTEIRAVLAPDNARSAAVCRRLGMTSTGLTDRWYGRELAEFRITADQAAGMGDVGAMTGPTDVTLNLWRRPLDEVPAEVWDRTELTVLILAETGISELPPGIGRLTGLRTIDLGHNRLAELPVELFDLTGLEDFLYLHDNALTALPEELGRLTALRYLNVGENQLAELPATIGGLASLVELRAQHNRLTALPESIGGLRSLRELWLRGNELTGLPESFGWLGELRELELRENALAEVPAVLAGLPRLRRLDLRGNRIADLPDWLADPGALPALEKLDLRWNDARPSARLVAELAARGCVTLF